MKLLAAALVGAFSTALAGQMTRLGRLGRDVLGALDSPAASRGDSATATVVICNAYPSSSSATVSRNEKEALADRGHPIPFKECRHVTSRLAPRDRLAFALVDADAGSGVEGSFEVGELPRGAPMLLVVLEKRNATSPLVSFQSFAFEASGNRTGAQLALVDAYRGSEMTRAPSAVQPILLMTGGKARAEPKPVQELSFNRVYAIEQGNYEASVVDRAGSIFLQESAGSAAADARLAARNGQAHVVLRVGDGRTFGPSLVTFSAPIAEEDIDEDILCSKQTGGSCHLVGCKKSRGHVRCASGECLCAFDYCADGLGRCLKKEKAKLLPKTYQIEVVNQPGRYLYMKKIGETIGGWEGDPGPQGRWRVLVNNDGNTVMLYTEEWGTDYFMSVEEHAAREGSPRPSYRGFDAPYGCSFEVHTDKTGKGKNIYLKDVRLNTWIQGPSALWAPFYGLDASKWLDREAAKLRFHPPLTEEDVKMLKDQAPRAWPLLPLLLSALWLGF